MINQQLLDYIRAQKESGTDDATIKENLESAGWRSQDVDEGFQAIDNNLDQGDSNSSAAHQQMRADAAGKRGADTSGESGMDSVESSPAANQQSDASGGTDDAASTDQQDQTSSPETGADDEYREDPNQDSEETQAVDEAAGQNQAEDVNADEGAGLKEIGGAEAEKGSPNSGSKTISEERMNKMSNEASNKEVTEPKALRTFESDQRDAGGSVERRSHPEKNQSSSQEKADDTDAGTAKVAAGAAAATAGGSQEQMSEERKEYEDRQNKAAQEESQLDKELAGGGASKPKKPEAKNTPTNKQSTKKRKSQDGGRRFSAKKQSGGDTLKKRREKTRSGSSAGWLSITLFIVAVLLVGGGGYYGYVTYFSGEEAPQITSQNVMSALANSGSFNFRMTVREADDTAATNTAREVTAVVEGFLDLDNQNDVQSYYTFQGQEAPSTNRVEAVSAETETIGAVPEEQLSTVRETLLTPKFFSVGEFQATERLGVTEDKAGFSTNRYRASVNPTQIVSDYANLHQALFGEPLSQNVLSNLQSTVGNFQPTNGQIWVNPESGVPYQLTVFGNSADGGTVQVDFKFKNHGVSPSEQTPAYDPQPFSRSLETYFSQTESESEQPTSTEPNIEEPGENAGEPEEGEQTTDSQASAENAARRTDRLRVNDIQQLSVALEIYAQEAGEYPDSLTALLGADQSVLSQIPTDPQTDNSYTYSSSPDGTRYHLGATLEQLRRADVSSDANFNSRAQGFSGGFNGTAATCASSPSATGSTCYDVTGTRN